MINHNYLFMCRGLSRSFLHEPWDGLDSSQIFTQHRKYVLLQIVAAHASHLLWSHIFTVLHDYTKYINADRKIIIIIIIQPGS